MRRAVFIALLLLSVGLPAAAHAAKVSRPYTYTETVGPDEHGQTFHLPLYQVQFEAEPGEKNEVSIETSDSGYHVLVKDAGAALEPGTNCKSVPGGVECALPPSGFIGGIDVRLGDGDDKATIDSDNAGGAIHGGPGDDDIRTANSTITLDGGEGADRLEGNTVTYADRTAPVNVSLDGVANDGEAGEGDNVMAEVVFAGAGDDVLTASQGEGAPPVQLFGAAGDDVLTGGPGRDQLFAGDGDDVLTGGAGDDYLAGDHGRDSFDAGAGDDDMHGDAHPKFISGGPGHDGLAFSTDEPLEVSLDPGLGDESYTRPEGVEELTGGTAADTLIGSDAAERIVGGGGNDTIYALGGDDRVESGPDGGSYVDPGSGRDFVRLQGPGDQVELRDGEKDTLGCQHLTDRRVIERDRPDQVYCLQFRFFRGATRVRASRRGVVELPLACPRGQRCAGTIALRWHGRTIRTQAFDRRPGSKWAARFKLGRVARHELARGRKLRLAVALEVRLHPEPAAAHSAARPITVLSPDRKHGRR